MLRNNLADRGRASKDVWFGGRLPCQPQVWVPLVLALAVTLRVHAVQRWTRSYGGPHDEIAFEVCETQDGGFAVAGRYGGVGPQHGNLIWLLKTDSFGDTMWTQVYGRRQDEYALTEALAQTRDGGFLIPGTWESHGMESSGVFLIRTDSLGETLWTRPVPGLRGVPRDAKQTHDGGFIVTGRTAIDTLGYIYAIRCDSLGSILWVTYNHGVRSAWAYSVQQTADCGFVIAGSTYVPGRGDWGYLLRLDSLGDTLWGRAFHVGGGLCYPYEVQVLPDGGFAVGGNVDIGGDGFACLIRTDSLGETLWTRRYAGTAHCTSLDLCSDGGFVLGGTCSSMTGCDVWILKTSASGDSQWARSLPNNYDEYANVVRQTRDGGYISAGAIFFSTSSNDFYLVKTDANGFAAVQERAAQHVVDADEPRVVVRTASRVLCFLPSEGISSLGLFDIVGRRIATLENCRREAGWHEVELKGKLQAGAYFARLEAGRLQAVAKFVVPGARSD